MPCPNTSCGAHLSRRLIFQRCHRCQTYACPLCGVKDDRVHMGRSCSEYLAEKERIRLDQATCPHRGCGGAMSKAAMYQRCPSCNTYSCPICHVSNEAFHMNKSCDAFQADLAYCPNPSCQKAVSKQKGYQQCPACNTHGCPSCGAMDDHHHHHRSCQEYQAEKRRLESFSAFLRPLIKEARDFTQANWPADMPVTNHVHENQSLAGSCPSLQRFLRGKSQLNITDLSTRHGFFAWHGTPSEDGVIGICYNGFDPSKRAGQVCGPGEYFGVSAPISRGYARSTDRLIVAFILQCSSVSTRAGKYIK